MELADHPNIIGIKESSGNVEKVTAMVRQTRHIKRTAKVTEVQQAVTGRMLAAPQADALVTLGTSPGAVAVAPPKALALKTRTKEVGFQVLVGAAHTLLPSLQAGASGGVLCIASPAPTICFEIYSAWRDNDLELARSKQEGLAPVSRRVVSELGIPAVKYAMDLNGYYGGPPRLPLLPLTAAQKKDIESHMEFFRN